MSRGVSQHEAIEEAFRTLQIVRSQIEMSLRAALAGRGVSLGGLIMLRILISRGIPTTASTLADSMMLSNGSVTMFIHQLEAAGYVNAVRMPLDRRVVLVTPTPKAKAQFVRLHSLATDKLTRLFSGWGSHDIETLQRLVNQLTVRNWDKPPETPKTNQITR